MERIVGSLRPDKPGQARIFAFDGSAYTAAEALWLKGQRRSAGRACASVDEAGAASMLNGMVELVNLHRCSSRISE